MNILVIQNIGCEHLGNLAKLFELDGFNVTVLNSQNHLIPTDLHLLLRHYYIGRTYVSL